MNGSNMNGYSDSTPPTNYRYALLNECVSDVLLTSTLVRDSPGSGAYGDYPVTNSGVQAVAAGDNGAVIAKPQAAQALNFSSARGQPRLQRQTGPDVVL